MSEPWRKIWGGQLPAAIRGPGLFRTRIGEFRFPLTRRACVFHIDLQRRPATCEFGFTLEDREEASIIPADARIQDGLRTVQFCACAEDDHETSF
jgi:hypothetical protein